MVRQHHPLNGHESQQTLGGSERQRGLVCSMESMGSHRVGHSDSTTIKILWEFLKRIII